MFDDIEFACPCCYGSALKFTANGIYCLDLDCDWWGDYSQVIVYTPFIGPLTLEEAYG